MAKKRAKTIAPDQFDALLNDVMMASRRPLVDRVAFLLSYRAGLRVQEIAGLKWKEHLLGPKGEFNIREVRAGGKKISRAELYVGGDVGKAGVERTLLMKPDLYEAICALYADPKRSRSPYVIPSGKAQAGQDLKARASALKMRLNRMYRAMGYDGMSTHSGRRTFITTLARNIGQAGGSLKDVQDMAGHKFLETTENYIDVSDNQAAFIDLL
jgi:integrase